MRIIELGPEHCGWEPGMTLVRRLGLDPLRIMIPNTLTLDDARRTVTVEHYFVLDEQGRPLVDESRNCVVTETVTVQLEAPALPWPEPPALPER